MYIFKTSWDSRFESLKHSFPNQISDTLRVLLNFSQQIAWQPQHINRSAVQSAGSDILCYYFSHQPFNWATLLKLILKQQCNLTKGSSRQSLQVSVLPTICFCKWSLWALLIKWRAFVHWKMGGPKSDTHSKFWFPQHDAVTLTRRCFQTKPESSSY